jgi:hypothetical protein
MDLLKTSAMLKALILKMQKYDKIGDLQAQAINRFYYLFFSLGTPYYQEGCNISSKPKDQKCSLVDLCEI